MAERTPLSFPREEGVAVRKEKCRHGKRGGKNIKGKFVGCQHPMFEKKVHKKGGVDYPRPRGGKIKEKGNQILKEDDIAGTAQGGIPSIILREKKEGKTFNFQ